MKIKDYMTSDIVKCDINDEISTIAEIMDSNNVGFVAVLENDEIIGVITDRDIVIGPVMDNTTSIEDFVNKNIISLDKNDDVNKALLTMRENKIKRILVTDDERYTGVLSIYDLFDTDLKDEIFNTLREIKS